MHSRPLKTSHNILLTVIPAVLWLGATYARPFLIQAHCMTSPQFCTKGAVMAIDQLSLGMEDSAADGFSYQTQNISGIWALTLPLAWNLAQGMTGAATPALLALRLGRDLTLFLQTISWNGLLTEISHLMAQRPRPFVYSDPTYRGIDPSHYTSFYSGHTSFAAAMGTCSFLILYFSSAPLSFLILSFASTQALIFSTAYFRIIAGRHFLTDVICGAIAGSLIAYFLVKLSFRNPRESSTVQHLT